MRKTQKKKRGGGIRSALFGPRMPSMFTRIKYDLVRKKQSALREQSELEKQLANLDRETAEHQRKESELKQKIASLKNQLKQNVNEIRDLSKQAAENVVNVGTSGIAQKHVQSPPKQNVIMQTAQNVAAVPYNVATGLSNNFWNLLGYSTNDTKQKSPAKNGGRRRSHRRSSKSSKSKSSKSKSSKSK